MHLSAPKLNGSAPSPPCRPNVRQQMSARFYTVLARLDQRCVRRFIALTAHFYSGVAVDFKLQNN
jgi:hypothetical protein